MSNCVSVVAKDIDVRSLAIVFWWAGMGWIHLISPVSQFSGERLASQLQQIYHH